MILWLRFAGRENRSGLRSDGKEKRKLARSKEKMSIKSKSEDEPVERDITCEATLATPMRRVYWGNLLAGT